MLRFDDTIAFDGTDVVALGPIDAIDAIREVCAWVYQPTAGRQQDAAATEMTTSAEGLQGFRQTTSRWVLRLNQVGALPVAEGPAFAVAVALLRDTSSNERVVWWGHPVVLVHSSAYVNATNNMPTVTSARDDVLPSFNSVLDQPV
jgi:hypothetical protein